MLRDTESGHGDLYEYKESTAVQSLNEQLARVAATQKILLESGTSELSIFGGLRPMEDDTIDVDIEVTK